MRAAGFNVVLSEEDTGTGERNHNNGSGTEWWVAFYRRSAVTVPDDLPYDFLATDRESASDRQVGEPLVPDDLRRGHVEHETSTPADTVS